MTQTTNFSHSNKLSAERRAYHFIVVIELEDCRFVIKIAAERTAKNRMNSDRKHFLLETLDVMCISISRVRFTQPAIANALPNLWNPQTLHCYLNLNILLQVEEKENSD